jgi:hypothetical protein
MRAWSVSVVAEGHNMGCLDGVGSVDIVDIVGLMAGSIHFDPRFSTSLSAF